MDSKGSKAEASAKARRPKNANDDDDKENTVRPVSSLTDKDIPMGQGSSTQGSKGHQNYMKIINRDYKAYLALKGNTEELYDFASRTLTELCNSHYVFRQKNKDTDLWEVITDRKLLVGKIKKSMRDRAKKDKNSGASAGVSVSKKRKEGEEVEEEDEEVEFQDDDLAAIVAYNFASIGGGGWKKQKVGAAVAAPADKAIIATSAPPKKRADPRAPFTSENIGEYDVLDGREGNLTLWNGNRHFRRLAEAKKRRYKAAPRNTGKKDSIAKEIIQETKKRGGRLIQKLDGDEKKELFVVVDDGGAKWLEKTKELLRGKENPNMENIEYEAVRSSIQKLPFTKKV